MPQPGRLVARVVERRDGSRCRRGTSYGLQHHREALADADADRGDAVLPAVRLAACRRACRGSRPPDAPSGWPIAIAPPLTFTRSGSSSVHSPTQASDWAAKASLSSTASTSPQVIPARLSARLAASTGPMPKMSGSTAKVPRPAIRAIGSRPAALRARLAGDEHGGGAVVERRRVAGGHGAVLDEGGLELGELLERAVGADALVARQVGVGDRDDLAVVEARVPRRSRALVAA